MIRKAMLLSVCGLLFAGAAFASVPSSATSTLPAGIRLVGTASGVADPNGEFTVTVRDIGGNIIPNSSVVIDVSAAGPDIKVSSAQAFAGLTVDCPTKTVRALTNGSGVATFRVAGMAAAGAFSPFLSGKIFADGVLLGNRTVAAYNLDGSTTASGNVGGNDLSILTGDFFNGNAAERSDLDFSSLVGGNDLSLLTAVFFAGTSTNAVVACP